MQDEGRLFAAWTQMLTGGPDLDGGLFRGRAAPQIYRRALLASCVQVMRDHYPVSSALLGEANLTGLVFRHLRLSPPATASLDHHGADWPPFLAGQAEIRLHQPHLPAFAILDFMHHHPLAPESIEVVAPTHLQRHYDHVRTHGTLAEGPLGPATRQRWVRGRP